MKVQWFPPLELAKCTGLFLSEQNLPAIISVTLSKGRYFTTKSETVFSEAKCDK